MSRYFIAPETAATPTPTYDYTSSYSAIQSELNGTSGGLQQSTFVFGLTAGDESDVIFPYDTTQEYRTAVDRYSVYSVLFQDQLNGYSADSDSAVTGLQYG